MNAIDLLISQHRSLEAQMNAVLDADKTSAKQRLMAHVGDELSIHIASEERLFYPAVKSRRTQDVLLESLEEHLSLKRLLADLLDLDPSEPTFEAKFKVMKEQAEHHHDEEENTLFPQVRLLMDDVQLGDLAHEVMALQDRLRRSCQPRDAVMSETGQAAPLG